MMLLSRGLNSERRFEPKAITAQRSLIQMKVDSTRCTITILQVAVTDELVQCFEVCCCVSLCRHAE